MEQMRVFDTGASRSSGDKLDYARALSVQVLERYVQYLQSHRAMPDGSKRDFDNWKRGIPTRDYVSSLVRHTVDTERKYFGLPVPENATLEDLCCSVIFNASGLLFELLVEKSGNRELEGPHDVARESLHRCLDDSNMPKCDKCAYMSYRGCLGEFFTPKLA